MGHVYLGWWSYGRVCSGCFQPLVHFWLSGWDVSAFSDCCVAPVVGWGEFGYFSLYKVRFDTVVLCLLIILYVMADRDSRCPDALLYAQQSFLMRGSCFNKTGGNVVELVHQLWTMSKLWSMN